MDEEFGERIGRNEAVFREVNEAIESGQWPGEGDVPTAFCCECGRLGCSQLIELTVQEYERARADPRRFLVAHGHEISEAETVVERHGQFLVVQKRAGARREAEARDPRD